MYVQGQLILLEITEWRYQIIKCISGINDSKNMKYMIKKKEKKNIDYNAFYNHHSEDCWNL